MKTNRIFLILLSLLIATRAMALSPPEPSALEQRVATLEKKLNDLSIRLASLTQYVSQQAALNKLQEARISALESRLPPKVENFILVVRRVNFGYEKTGLTINGITNVKGSPKIIKAFMNAGQPSAEVFNNCEAILKNVSETRPLLLGVSMVSPDPNSIGLSITDKQITGCKLGNPDINYPLSY